MNLHNYSKLRALFIKCALILAVSVAPPLLAQPATLHSFNLSAQPLAQAITQVSEQTGVVVLVPQPIAADMLAPALSGDMTPIAAFERLLVGSGLAAKEDASGAIVITQVVQAEGKQSAVGSDNRAKSRIIEEVIVTATKREQSIQDISMSITAIGNEEIERRGLVGMGDYLNSVPGVSVLDMSAGSTAVVIRGIAINAQEDGGYGPTVGIYFGETPLSGFGIGGANADIKMVDLERVEVLRGPQGTLYGSSNLGGTVRNIPMMPNLDEFEGKIKAGYSSTAKPGGENSEIQGVLNIPIIDNKLALRAVGYRFENSGFYKNVGPNDPAIAAAVETYGAVAVARDDIGNDEYVGGRISALWRPLNELSINITYLNQDVNQDGWPQADLALGEGDFLQRRMQIRHPSDRPNFGEPIFGEEYGNEIEITNAVVEYDIGWANLMSSSSWVDSKSKVYRELGSFFGFIPWSQPLDERVEAFVEEVRLASHFDGPLQFVGGLYYEEIDTKVSNWGLFGGDPERNPFANQVRLLGLTLTNNSVKQTAIFGELTYKLTNKIEVVAGARLFEYERDNSDIQEPAPFSFPSTHIESDANDINYKAGIDYTPNENTLVYASWSQGFRLGRPVLAETRASCDQDGDGIYDGSGGLSTGPRQLDSDYVDNYELGGKFSLLENRLQINTTIYQADWEGIPTNVFFGQCGAFLNAGKARSRGAEFDGSYYFDDDVLINFGASYVNAELTENAPFLGDDGDRLPGAPEYNFNLGVEYNFTLAGREAFVRSDYYYVGGFYNNLQETDPEIGDYGKWNMRAGILLNRISIEIFADNITNEDNLTWVDSEGFTDLRGNYLRPRTIGMNVGYTF